MKNKKINSKLKDKNKKSNSKHLVWLSFFFSVSGCECTAGTGRLGVNRKDDVTMSPITVTTEGLFAPPAR